MPRIKDYRSDMNQAFSTTPRSMVQGQARATSFGSLEAKADAQMASAVGNAAQAGFDMLVQYDKRQAQKQILSIGKELAIHEQQHQTAIDQAYKAGDPADEEKFEALIAASGTKLEEIQQLAETKEARDYFDKQSAMSSRKILNHAAKVKAHYSGEKAKVDFEDFLSLKTANAFQSPDQLDDLIIDVDLFVENVSGLYGLGEIKAKELKNAATKELALSSSRGMIRLAPENFLKYLKADKKRGDDSELKKYGLSGKELDSLWDQAQSEINAKRIEAERQKRAKNDALTKEQLLVQHEFIRRMFSPAEGDEPVTEAEIASSILDPTGGGSKKQFLDWMDKQNKGAKFTTNPYVYQRVMNMIHTGVITDSRELTQFLGENSISPMDLTRLRKEIDLYGVDEFKAARRNKTTFMKNAKEQITGTKGIFERPSKKQQELWKSFSDFIQDREIEYRAKGIDLREMYHVDGKFYLGDFIKSYKPTMSEVMDYEAGQAERTERDSTATIMEKHEKILEEEEKKNKEQESEE